MAAYYNEIDPYAAQWLRNLILAGHIAPGEVDERSIANVAADDLRGFTQCHFFAGIGGWSYALRLAGWPDSRHVWTGSCPCQPFSVAGKGKGKSDERHLWPVWRALIEECRPATVFGEQTSGAIRFGWLDEVAGDLEANDYALASAVLPAGCVGAFHVRERLWFAASDTHADSLRSQGQRPESGGAWSAQQFEGLVQDQLSISVPTGKSGGVVDGLPADLAYSRASALKSFGNAIVPQVAAEFIGAMMECMP